MMKIRFHGRDLPAVTAFSAVGISTALAYEHFRDPKGRRAPGRLGRQRPAA